MISARKSPRDAGLLIYYYSGFLSLLISANRPPDPDGGFLIYYSSGFISLLISKTPGPDVLGLLIY